MRLAGFISPHTIHHPPPPFVYAVDMTTRMGIALIVATLIIVGTGIAALASTGTGTTDKICRTDGIYHRCQGR